MTFASAIWGTDHKTYARAPNLRSKGGCHSQLTLQWEIQQTVKKLVRFGGLPWAIGQQFPELAQVILGTIRTIDAHNLGCSSYPYH